MTLLSLPKTSEELLLDVESAADLLSALGSIDITCPPPHLRQNKIGKEKREKWVACRLLASLFVEETFHFPLTVRHFSGQNPDFVLEFQEHQTGIHVTECTDELFKKYCVLASKNYPKSILDFGMFIPGRRRPTEQEMLEQLSTNRLVSKGWGCLDKPWVDGIFQSVKKKLKKLSSRDMRREQNWLAIYSNTPFEDIDINSAAQDLKQQLDTNQLWRGDVRFHRIFIERGRNIIRLSSHECSIIPLNDLWLRPKSFIESDAMSMQETSDEQLWDEVLSGRNSGRVG